MRPLCIELFAGTFGWSAGWHELGGRTIGFDIDHQPYHGPVPPGDDLVLQDVLSLNGRQFKDASLILASPPCTEFAYMAMPWTRAKQIARALRGEGDFPDDYKGSRKIKEMTALFDACFRIQREASEAAGHHIPMVVENVRGAQPWVGRARWSYGSYALFGDVPALMPITGRTAVKVDGKDRATKNSGGSWFNVAHNTTSGKGQNPDGRQVAEIAMAYVSEGRKGYASGTGNLGKSVVSRMTSSKSSARKAASAIIARIPFQLSRHIARTYYPAKSHLHKLLDVGGTIVP